MFFFILFYYCNKRDKFLTDSECITQMTVRSYAITIQRSRLRWGVNLNYLFFRLVLRCRFLSWNKNMLQNRICKKWMYVVFWCLTWTGITTTGTARTGMGHQMRHTGSWTGPSVDLVARPSGRTWNHDVVSHPTDVFIQIKTIRLHFVQKNKVGNPSLLHLTTLHDRHHCHC